MLLVQLARRSPVLLVAPPGTAARGAGALVRNVAVRSASTSSSPIVSAIPGITEKYESLCDRLKEINQLSGAVAILGWDEQTMMPPGAASSRGQQKAALAAIIHEKQTDENLASLIQELQEGKHLNCEFARANCRDAKRDYDLESSKSKEMAKLEAELEADCFNTWVTARKENDWKAMEPKLKKMFDLKREIAKATRPDLPTYDGALDAFERGMPSSKLDSIFSQLKKDLVPLVKEVTSAKGYKIPPELKDHDFDVKKQAEMCIEIAKDIGFDISRGRFDVSAHPFTGGVGPSDVRITTRYSPKNWAEGLGGTIHEVGHALYEQGRSMEHQDLPVSRALSMGVHESQSLLWERMVFQGRPFWDYATPIIHKYFPHTKDITADELYKAVNHVQPGLIRTEADELTYPLHIMLRYNLEKSLMEDSVDVSCLPKIWNEDMKRSLGVSVPSDADGVMQDVHWNVGAIGYFPSYTLGAMMAVQFYNEAKKQIPDLESKISKGEFGPLKDWLNQKVHQVGSLYASPDELLIAVTGKPLDAGCFMEYLQEKYSKLYSL